MLIALAFFMPLTVFGGNLIIVLIVLLWFISGNYNDKFYWLFPGGQTEKPPPKLEYLFKRQLESVIQSSQSNSIWGLSKESIVFTSGKVICFTLRGQLASIKLYNVKRVHEDRDNIFLRPENFSVHDITGNCSEEITLL